MSPNLEDCIAKLGNLTEGNIVRPGSHGWKSTLEHVLSSLHRYKPPDAEALIRTRHIVDKLDEVRLNPH
jgi:hypothetical protein